MVLAVVCCGRTICFCSDDPDGCGEECHVCGDIPPDGVSSSDPCDHLSFGTLDFWNEDGGVTLGGNCHVTVVPVWASVAAQNQFSQPCRLASRANAPPGTSSDSVLFRLRRILLLS
jgi:hypothetical protein